MESLESKKIILPKLGMRTVKTGICVLICIALYYISGGFISNYTAIVAIVCLQNTIQNSLQVARDRGLGTAIGGAFGLLILSVLGVPISHSFNVMLLICIPIALILLIYLCNIIRIQSTIVIASIVFISIFINQNTQMSPFVFALTRIMDTLIGIGVAMLVNIYIVPAKEKEMQRMHIACDNFEVIYMRVAEYLDKDATLLLYSSYLTDTKLKKIKNPYANVGVRIPVPVEYAKDEKIKAVGVAKDYSLTNYYIANDCGYVHIPVEAMPCTVVWREKTI